MVLLVAVVLGATTAHAQPVGTTRVAVVETARLFSPAGIARYREALARLDAEKATFRAAESPTGKSPEKLPVPDLKLGPKQQEELKREFEKLDRESAKRQAWADHVAATLDPIRQDVMRALAQYAQGRGIGLVLERSGSELVIVGPGTDITAAFIKDYDAKAAKPPRH